MVELAPRLWHFNELGRRVNVYLWRGRDGLTLIDAGYAGYGYRMLAALADVGFALTDVARIVITHGDLDHIGGLAELYHALRVPIYCHAYEAPLLRRPTQRVFHHSRWRHVVDPAIHTLMRTDRYAFVPVAPTHLVQDQDCIGDELIVIHTPGHTPGHIALWQPEAGVLFSGDACLVRHGRLWCASGAFTPDMKGARMSVLKLAALCGPIVETLASGHSRPVMTGAGDYLRTYAQEQYL